MVCWFGRSVILRFGGLVVRWFGGQVLRCFDASVLRWFWCFGCFVLRWCGGSVVWWFGGSAVRWFVGGKKGGRCGCMNAVSPFALLRVSLAAGVSLRAALCLAARGHCIDYLASGCMVWLGSLWGDIAATAQSPCLCLACERSWVQFLLFPLQGSCVPSPCLWLFPASLGAVSVVRWFR